MTARDKSGFRNVYPDGKIVSCGRYDENPYIKTYWSEDDSPGFLRDPDERFVAELSLNVTSIGLKSLLEMESIKKDENISRVLEEALKTGERKVFVKLEDSQELI